MLHHHRLKKVFCFMVLVAFSLLFSGGSEAQAKGRRKTRPKAKTHHILPVEKTALYADLVIEAQTGRVLHATNATELRHPASLTKMMTLYICFQALENGTLRLDDRLLVSSHAAAQAPSKLGLKPGQRIRLYDAIMGIVTKSANDAAVVLAEALAGSEDKFAQMMTRQARDIGMTKTVFRNASGLPDLEQVTTAQDMAILGHALVYHYPHYYSFFSHESFTYAGQTLRNHNHLMERYEGMDGIKTGYVRASGFNLVASAIRGRTRLIGVVFGGKSTSSRDNRMAQLLDQAFLSKEAEGTPIHKASGIEAQGDADTENDDRYITLPGNASIISNTGQQGKEAKTVFTMASPDRMAVQWGIQIGAYNDSETGQQALTAINNSLPALLKDAEPVVEKIQTSDGAIVYRARFMGMPSSTARSICAYIVKRGQGCHVVSSARRQDS